MMNFSFPQRMKELRIKHQLTQKEAAKALGIGQTTIANYENGTRVPDLEKTAEIAELFGVSVDYLIGREGYSAAAEKKDSPAQETAEYAFEDYMKALVDGDKKTVRKIILSFLRQGIPSATIYKDYIERSLVVTGELWEKGELPIWKEHFISEISMENMSLIKRRKFKEAENYRPILAVVPGAEQHSIGIRMISDMLESHGYNVIFLGSGIPADNILQAIEANKPRAVLISVTMPYHTDSAKMLIQTIKQRFGTKSPTLMIGGNALQYLQNPAVETGADLYCADLEGVIRNLNRI